MIVDDEQPSHQVLEQYILKSSQLTLVAKCRNALEAFAKLEQHTIDLIFLDIEMPLVNGLTFLRTLKHPPHVILTTAYSEHALEGFDLNVVDYLLKPYSFERFTKAVQKVKLLKDASENKSNVEITYLLIKEKGGLMKIAHSGIIYIEASGDYMKIVTQQGQHLVHLTMKSLEEDLPKDKFVRTHKSYIVALGQIKVLKTDSLLISGNVEIPVSANYKEIVENAFKSK